METAWAKIYTRSTGHILWWALELLAEFQLCRRRRYCCTWHSTLLLLVICSWYFIYTANLPDTTVPGRAYIIELCMEMVKAGIPRLLPEICEDGEGCCGNTAGMELMSSVQGYAARWQRHTKPVFYEWLLSKVVPLMMALLTYFLLLNFIYYFLLYLTLLLLNPVGWKVPKPWRYTWPVGPTGYIGGNVGRCSMHQWYVVRTLWWSSAYWC